MSRYDVDFFKRYYLPHWFKLPGCELHTRLDKLIFELTNRNEARRIAIAAPRGSAKSTELAFLLPLYAICMNAKHNIPIIGNSATQAQEHVVAIRDELTTNEKIKHDFPEVFGEGTKWTESDIITTNGTRVRAFGRGGAIRGTKRGEERPDLIIGDDIDDDESVRTPDQRDKHENWWFKAVSKAGYTKSTSLVLIGTILHYDCLVAKMLRNPAYEALFYKSVYQSSESKLWDTWKTIFNDKESGGIDKARALFIEHKDEMLSGTKVLWPENEDYYDLMALRESEGPASFNSEKQNEPIDPKDCRFQNFHFYDTLPKIVEYYGACDPSLGKDMGDYTAIIVLGKDALGYLYVLEAIIERMQPNVITETIINLPYKFDKFGIETVAFQEFFKTQVEEASRKASKYIPIVGIKNEGTRKEVRIDRLQPHILNGTLKLRKEHYRLMEQLKFYPLADHDDGPDALEMAVRLADRGRIQFGGNC